MHPLNQAWIVGVAGFVGAVARLGVTAIMARLGVASPVGTLAINVVGSLALGLLLGWGAAKGTLPEHLRLAIGVGFLGAFTTFSTFSAETDALLRGGANLGAVGYVLLSVLLGVGAARLGYVLMT